MPQPSASHQRIIELDIVRGLLLVNIMINHVPGDHNYYSSQPLGFVSSAEGFFLLSGYLLGSISARRATQGKPLFDRLAKRIGLIYLSHILALLLVFLVIGLGLGHLQPYANITYPYQEYQGSAVLSALLLLYQPPLLDILPLYIIFMSFTPVIWWLARRLHWLPVFALSASLWLWAQFHSMNELLGGISPWLLVQWGSFHLLAWQLLWVIGLGLGAWHWQERDKGLQIPNWLSFLAVLTALFFFTWRMQLMPVTIDLGEFWILIDKWILAPLRLLNFLALLVVAIRFAGFFRILLRPFGFLGILGRHSLLVFSVHSFIGLLLAGWIEFRNPPENIRLLLLALQIGFVFFWAWRLEQNNQRQASTSGNQLLASANALCTDIAKEPNKA